MGSRLDSTQMKLVKSTTFPPEFEKKVNITKVETTIVKK